MSASAKVTVTLEQPVHAGTGPLPDYRNPTHDHIPGSVLRGGCAAAWIRALGAPEPGTAHRQSFIEAFESDGVFGPLHRAGSLPVPVSVLVHKYQAEPGCQRLWWDRSLGAQDTECPDCGQNLMAAKGEPHEPPARVQRTRAALSTEGVAEDEKLYRKDSLDRRQVFTGWISGGALGAFEVGGEPVQRLWLGGGRTTGGLARVSIDPEAEPEPLETDGSAVVLRLASPAIFVDAAGLPAGRPSTAELQGTLGVTVVSVDALGRGSRLACRSRPGQADRACRGGRIDLPGAVRAPAISGGAACTAGARSGPAPARGLRRAVPPARATPTPGVTTPRPSGRSGDPVTPTLITIRLRLLSPGGVAGPERRQADPASEPSNHLALRQDPDGAIALPGSTIAGSLRAHCANWIGLPDGLFGSEPGAQEKVASPIQVLGVRLHGELPVAESTTRVAIDRHRGAARVHALFTVEQLPAGTEFDVHLRWDGAGAALECFLDAVRAWRPRIGRGVTVGSGACAVTGLGWHTYDLTDVDGLLAWLAIAGPGTYPQPTEVLQEPPSPDAVIDVRLEIVDGLHVGTGVPGQLPGHESEVSLVVQRHGVPHVPGSSLKGVLRSRVEYICRVLGQPACDDAGCGACRACLLFGWSPRSGADPQLGGARAAVVIPDAMIDAAELDVRSHVALDRVTGGARPGLLYTQQVVVAGHFRLRVEPLRPLLDVELALLRASIADVHDGLVGIGGATTRGLGTVRVNDEAWVPPDLSALAELVAGGCDG